MMTNEQRPYEERIVLDPEVLEGKPVIKDTRISVSLILNLLAHGYDFAQIKDDYPNLRDQDIQAAIHYSENQTDLEDTNPFPQSL